MNNITFDSDKPMTINSVNGRLTHRTVKPGSKPGIWTRQRWVSESRPISEYGHEAKMKVEMRFDDDCGNGHNTFAITAEVRRPRANDVEACGMMHDEIKKVFPELAGLLKWHLTSSDGPLHYIANTMYHAETKHLNYARSTAVWPDATDEQLTVEPAELREMLETRLPRLMAEFRSAMESAGFVWNPEDMAVLG